MNFGFVFFLNSFWLGVGLAMDAFSVSLTCGLNESNMSKRRICAIAGTFGGFQAAMPLLGWICVHTIIRIFMGVERFIPFIALVLLMYIGIKMLIDGIKNEDVAVEKSGITNKELIVLGIATSIDALSVGFTIAEYDLSTALVEVMVIAIVTFVICIVGIQLGKKFGNKFSNKATIFGGVILIAIGLEIFISSLL